MYVTVGASVKIYYKDSWGCFIHPLHLVLGLTETKHQPWSLLDSHNCYLIHHLEIWLAMSSYSCILCDSYCMSPKKYILSDSVSMIIKRFNLKWKLPNVMYKLYLKWRWGVRRLNVDFSFGLHFACRSYIVYRSLEKIDNASSFVCS